MNGCHNGNRVTGFWLYASKSQPVTFFPYPELLERIAKEIYVAQKDWYESAKEIPPATLAKRAAEAIGNAKVPTAGMEVNPYHGAIHITWKNRESGRKVIAIFGPQESTVSLYKEERIGNHTAHKVIPNPTSADLHEKVLWCCSALAECAM